MVWWVSNGDLVASRWCHGEVSVVFRWCAGDVPAIVQCFGGVPVEFLIVFWNALQWCSGGDPEVFSWCDGCASGCVLVLSL